MTQLEQVFTLLLMKGDLVRVILPPVNPVLFAGLMSKEDKFQEPITPPLIRSFDRRTGK